MKNTFNLKGRKVLSKPSFPLQFFSSIISLLLFLLLSTSSFAQDCGSINCTSNDVRITGATLKANLNGDELAECNSGDPVNAYLFLQLSTNTPRIGVSISGRILNKQNNAQVAVVGQCFGVTLSGNNTIVKFTSPVTWTCGTTIILTDVLISWGTGNTNFCNTPYDAGSPEPAKCPGTKSKCWKQPPSEYFNIVTFPCTNPTITGQPANTSKCVGSAASFSATFTEGSPEATIVWQVSTDNGTTWSPIADDAVYDITNNTVANTTTSTLDISATTLGMHGNKYRIVLTNNTEDNQCGATSNGSATLSVYAYPSAPSVGVDDHCDGTSTLTATGYTGSLLWNTGATTASINVDAAGTYTVTQTVNGCTSSSGSGDAAPKTNPSAPSVGVENHCDGTSTLTASGYTGSLLWNTGETTASITVDAAGTYTVTQTVDGCTSGSGSAEAAPKSNPSAPSVAVDNHCDGTSTLTASGYTGSLLWNTGETTASIVVNAAGTYTVTQTVNGCTSSSGSEDANPGNTPEADPPVVEYLPPACDESTFSVKVTQVEAGATYTIKDKNGNAIPGVLPSGSYVAPNTDDFTFSNIPAGSGYQVTASFGECTTGANSCGASSAKQDNVVTQSVARDVKIELSDENPAVLAYPNPFNTTVNFRLVSPVSGRASLDIYNSAGTYIGNAFNGVLQANVPVNTTFKMSRPETGILFYRLMGSGRMVSGKIMSVR